MIKFILLLILLVMTITLNLSTTTRCDCSEYPPNICNAIFYCSWDSYGCIDLDCSYKPQNNCIPKVTMFKCDWDSINNECIQIQYTCNQILEKNYCEAYDYHGLDCMWQSINQNNTVQNNTVQNNTVQNDAGYCVDFNCDQSQHCNLYRCQYWKGQCGNQAQSSNCETLATEYCKSSDGQGQCCLLNDNNKCSSYDALVNCPQLSDNKVYCLKKTNYCVYENNACRNKLCEDILTESECEYTENVQTKQLTVCYWTGQRCRTASDLDIENFSLTQCLFNTNYNFKWEDSKCLMCSNNDPILIGIISLLTILNL